MTDLEEWVDGEALVELCSQTRKGLVGKEDISLHLSRDPIDCSWVAQTKCFSSLLYRSVCVEYCVDEAICARW